MNKFGIIRKIDRELKYNPVPGLIGVEVPVDIAQTGEEIADSARALIEERLDRKVIAFKGHDPEKTIAKYGLLDLTYEVEGPIVYSETRGISILRENDWVDTERTNDFQAAGLSYLKEMLNGLDEQKNYLKVYAQIKGEQSWLMEKTYLVRQLVRGERLQPKPEDQVQIFTIVNMCYTNYSGIWQLRYFYL